MAISIILAKKNAAASLSDDFDDGNGADRPTPPPPGLRKGNWSQSIQRGLGTTFGRKKSDDVESAIENTTIARKTLPPPELREREEIILKMTPQGDWEDRSIVITAENLIIAFPDTNYQVDFVPLHEITLVHRISVSSREQLSVRRESRDTFKHGKSMLPKMGRSPSRVAPNSEANSNRGLSSSRGSESESFGPREDDLFAFEVHTIPDGYNKGRSYTFGVDNESGREAWVTFLNQYVVEAAEAFANDRAIYRAQLFLSKYYNSTPSQLSVAGLIVGSFIANAIEAETNPVEGSLEQKFFEDLDLALTIIFTIELLINMAAHWMWPFFKNSWNVFDLIVVTSSLISIGLAALPGVTELRLLRLLRTFRVLRLFGRLKAIRRIIAAIGTSIVPVTNAFVIVFLVMALFAIMGVSLFREKSPQHFGKFSLALLTMFQCSTVEGWVQILEAVSQSTTDFDPLATFFFVMFIAIVAWVLLPVVMAVLLDNFTDEMMRDKEKEREKKTNETYFQTIEAGTLDPFLQTLADFESNKNLSYRTRQVFEALDVRGDRMLSFMDFSEGLKALSIGSNIHVSEEDWNHFTQRSKLCNAEGKLELEGFETMVRIELNDYLQRNLASNMSKIPGGSSMSAILSSLKLLLLDSKNARPATPQEKSNLERSRSGRERSKTWGAVKAVNMLRSNSSNEIKQEPDSPRAPKMLKAPPPIPEGDQETARDEDPRSSGTAGDIDLNGGKVVDAEDDGNPEQPETKTETLKKALSSSEEEGLSIKQLLISQIHMTKTIDGLRKSVEGMSDNLLVLQEIQRSQNEDIAKLKATQESFLNYMKKSVEQQHAVSAGWKDDDARELEKLINASSN